MAQLRFQLWLIWGVLLSSLVIYAGVAAVLVSGEATDPETASRLTPIFALVALGAAVTSFVLRNVMLTRPLARGALDPETPAGAQRVQTAFVLAWVFSETVGLFGFVLWFLGRDWNVFLAFLSAGAVLIALHAPLASRLRAPTTFQDLAAGRGKIG